MEAFFWLILLTGGLACSCAEPNLLISEEIVGVWRQSVILPCSYTPSPEYVEETVIWSFDGRAILRVVDHTEHVFLTKYRNRISLVRARAGDVSLRINSLQMNDKGHYRCEVGWRSDTIGKIQNDATMQLRISRASPVTENPNIEVVNTQRHPSTAVPLTTRKSKIEEINTQRPGRTAVPSATKNYEKEVNIQRTGLTAAPPAAAGAFGIPLYLVILICVLCIAMVAAAVTILITKKRKKPSQLYEVPNMAAMLVREGESCTQANGCQRCEEPRSRRENEYETGREGTYEKMETVKEAEYEMLNYERAEKN